MLSRDLKFSFNPKPIKDVGGVMKVRVLRPFMNTGGTITSEGQIIEVSINRATELEKKGLVVPTVGGKAPTADPFRARQLGGQTGAEKPAPSLPEAPAPELKKPSRKRKAKSKSSR